MPLRFIDTGFFKHPSIVKLRGPYKMLYAYILCDCDNSGMWSPEFNVASIYIDQKVKIEDARKVFEGKFSELENGKWFFHDFIQWQYPTGLSEKNPAHTKIIISLKRFNLLDSELKIKLPNATPLGEPTVPFKGTKVEVVTGEEDMVGVGVMVEEEPEPEISHRYVLSILQSCKNIQTLPNQLTNNEAEKLELRYGDAVVEDVLGAMENYKDLKKKYQSVYLTAISWIKLREEKKKNGTNQTSRNGSITNTFK